MPSEHRLTHHGRVRLEAITWDRLGEQLADRLLDLKPADGSPWPRVALDGAPAARPGELAERVAEALRIRGRPSLVVGMEGFLRPASLRLEYGHHDLEAYYSGWFDTGALWREVFGPSNPAATAESCPTCGTRSATAPPAVPMSSSRPAASCCCTAPSCCTTGSPST